MSESSYEVPILDSYHAVVLAFSEFLTVAIHTILYERDIYPQTSFFSARRYNYPVKQSKHPKVCRWIQDAVAAVEVEMLKVGQERFPTSITKVLHLCSRCMNVRSLWSSLLRHLSQLLKLLFSFPVGLETGSRRLIRTMSILLISHEPKCQ